MIALPFAILFARKRLAVLLQEITTIPIPNIWDRTEFSSKMGQTKPDGNPTSTTTSAMLLISSSRTHPRRRHASRRPGVWRTVAARIVGASGCRRKKKVFNVSPGFQNQRVVTELLYLGGLFNYSRVVLITLKELPIYVPSVADPDWTIQNQNISQMIPPPLRSSHRRMPLLRRFASWQMSRQNSGTIMFCVHDHGIDLQNCDCLSQSCQIWMTAYSVFHVVFESIHLCRIDSLVERKWSCCMLDVPWSKWNCHDLNIMNSNKYQARSLRCLHCAMAKEPTVLIVFWCKTFEARGKVRKLAGLL